MKPTYTPIDPATLTEAVMRRFWTRAVLTPTGCIEWAGSTDRSGYGQFKIGPRHTLRLAHRVSLVWALGHDITDRQVDHRCRNTACVRPDHLEAVTPRENLRRSTGRGAETIRLHELSGICRNGHDLTASNAWRIKKGNGRSDTRICRLCDNERVYRRNKTPEAREARNARRRQATAKKRGA